MTSPSIFDLGTATLTNGSAEVTGDGTAWAVNGVVGGMFSAGGMSVPIASVDDDTTLTLAYPWPGANAAGVAYAISLLGSQAADTIWASRHWSRIVGQALLAGIHPAASGTLVERDALNPMLEDGQWFAHAEPPYDLTFYRKVPSGWEGPYQFRGDASTVPGPAGDGFNPAGAWAIGTTYNKNDMVSHGPRSFVSFADGNVGNEPPSADEGDAYWQYVPAAVGPSNVLSIGTVSEGPADAKITGASPHQELNLTLPRGLPGADGVDGWTPVFAVVADGARYVQQVVEWAGGTGTKPPTGQYVGPAGFVSSIGDAVNIRGASGSGTGDLVGPSSAIDGEMALFDGVTGKLVKGGGAPTSGTVTSVAMSVPTGFSVSGSPVTASGALAITYSAGYEGFTTTLKNKLDGIEASADVTDTTNVAAAGAIMDGDFSANGMMARTDSGIYASRTVTAGTGIAVTNGNGASGNPTVALSSGAQASLALADSAAQLTVEDQVLTGGARVTSKSLGTVSSGTLTPDPGDRPLQHYTNGGAHTLAPGSNTGSYLLDITNNSSAGAITASGWTKVSGDAFTTVDGDKFRCHCSVGDAGSYLVVGALQ